MTQFEILYKKYQAGEIDASAFVDKKASYDFDIKYLKPKYLKKKKLKEVLYDETSYIEG